MPDTRDKEKNSVLIIRGNIIISVNAIIWITINHNLTKPSSNILKYTGNTLTLTGIIILVNVIRKLGMSFTVKLSGDSKHKIGKKGLCQNICHPFCQGTHISFTELGAFYNYPLILAVFFDSCYNRFHLRNKIRRNSFASPAGFADIIYLENTKRLISFKY